MMNYRLHTPEGVKDYLPREYAFKKQIENRSALTVILNAVGIPALSVLLTVLLWYAKLFFGR